MKREKSGTSEGKQPRIGRLAVFQLTAAAFCVVVNVVGAFLGVTLKLPLYLDNIGTILAGALLGPVWAAGASCVSGFISGVTSDIFALYFIPGAMLTGLMAGMLFRTNWLRGVRIPLGTAALTLPGAFVSACTAAFMFGGVTSAGSSIIVQILSRMGASMVVSAFVVQFLTEYADRLISVAVVCVIISRLSEPVKARLRAVR